jgi:biotin transport system substrate-specific component
MSNFLNLATTSGTTESRVLGDTLPGARVRDLLLVLGGTAFVALCAQISFHIPGSPVPVTMQSFSVVVVGAALGLRRGAAALALYLVAGLMLPIYAGGTSGTSVLWSGDGGYIVGFVAAAAITGWAAERGADRNPVFATITFAVGQAAIYVIGVPWLKVATGMSWGTAIHAGFTVFILAGIIKSVMAGVVMPSAWRLRRGF